MATKTDYWGNATGDKAAFVAWGSGVQGSYGANSFIYNPQSEDDKDSQWYWRTIDSCKPANIVPIILDAGWVGGHPGENQPPGNPQGTGQEINTFLINRHYGATNGVFTDLSVKRIPLKCMWRLKWSRLFELDGPWTVAGGVTRQIWENEAPWIAKFPECTW